MTDNKWMAALKGLIIGSTMIVPGVSGGSMAMILGIYDRLISAMSSFGKNIRVNLWFLIVFVLSAGAGIFLFSTPLTWLMEHHKMYTMYFFLGAVFGSIPLIEKKSQIQKVTWDVFLYMLIGAGIILLFSKIPEDTFKISANGGIGNQLMLFIAGILSASALVLPGISVSHFLLILGLYDELLYAIQTMNLGFLISLGIGVFFGILLLTRLLDYVMTIYPKQSYLTILGFIFASLGEIFPGIPSGFDILGCIGLAIAGFLAVYQMTKQEIEN